MQRDFHYYCIAVLAKAAGFINEDALTIAYASQYVDDSTESEPIPVGDLMFDPVRTAHCGLEAYDWAVQKRVYIPFHFIPPKPIKFPRDTFVTAANSSFAMMIFNEARKARRKRRRLCRIGVALHTFADTWSHQGFSGRRHPENDVEGIRISKGKRWRRLLWENILLDIAPKIGHAEAGYFPDESFLTWKCKRPSAVVKMLMRDNTSEFLAAAETIYKLLRGVKKPRSQKPIPWKALVTDVRKLLEDEDTDVNKRCRKWEKHFQYLFDPFTFRYDHLEWRRDALQARNRQARNREDVDWDDLERSDFRKLQFPMKPGFYDSLWVHFHRAALRQRHFVLEKLL